MKKNTLAYVLYGLSLAGTLFSGYLSGVKLFTKTCAFGEACPQFLGYPACYFGFALFLALFVLSTILVFRKSGKTSYANGILIVSIAGIIFAGKFVIEEFTRFAAEGFAWSALGLPTCAYGLIFYMLVLVFVLRYKRASSNETSI